MAAHVYHEWPDDKPEPILYDDCPECKLRAERPWDLDAAKFEAAWKLMVAAEHGHGVLAAGGRDYYLTANERRLSVTLYRTAVLMERHMGIDPWRWPPISVLAIVGDENAQRLSEMLGRDDT